MTSLQLATTFDQPRPMSQQAFHHSPADSPRQGLVRPASQASHHHLAPVATAPASFSPAIHTQENGPLTAFPGHFRPFTPSMTLPMPVPNSSSYNPYPPPTAPPLSYFPTSAPLYDSGNGNGKNGQDMMRTYSHAHPMHSATDRTASTRYSPPFSAGGIHQHSPPSATTYNMSSIQPQPTIQVSADQNQGRGHINPSLFNNGYNPNQNYPMSRSTSGASASDAGNEMGRLLTPHYFDQNQHRDHLSPHDEMRKLSDPMMNLGMGIKNRLYPASYAPAYEANGGHGLGLGAHPQPTELYWRTNNNQGQSQQQYGGVGEHYNMSSIRGGDIKPDLTMMNEDTEYERERRQQILDNRRLMEDVGLGYRRETSGNGNGAGHRRKTKNKRRSSYNGPVRQSGRIASTGRTSYADLDGEEQEQSSDEYSSNGDAYEEEEFRPTKKARGRVTYAQKATNKRRPQVELSLWGLLQSYPDIPHLFPLFYYTLNNDLTINSESVPLIGSIPSTVTPIEKADNLTLYYHRGRRVLAQLDTFSARCDRKYDGPEDKWPEMDYNTRIAVRDVRRKVVERCENYKYTRRDILDKHLGKNKWQPIEVGFVEWDPSTGNNDPAGDLSNVTLTLPTPPPSAYHQQHQQPRIASHHSSQGQGRTIRAFPTRRAPSHAYSNRIMSVNMSAPSPVYQQQQQPQTAGGSGAGSYYNPSSAIPQTAPPMYGEDEVPMSVQLHQHQHQGMGTPLQMIATPLPQVPGGNWNYQNHSHSQAHPHSHIHSQSQTPMPSSLTPGPMDNGGTMLNVDQSGSIIPAPRASGIETDDDEEEEEEGEEELKQMELSSSVEESGDE